MWKEPPSPPKKRRKRAKGRGKRIRTGGQDKRNSWFTVTVVEAGKKSYEIRQREEAKRKEWPRWRVHTSRREFGWLVRLVDVWKERTVGDVNTGKYWMELAKVREWRGGGKEKEKILAEAGALAVMMNEEEERKQQKRFVSEYNPHKGTQFGT